MVHNLEPTIKSLVESRKEKSILFAGHDLKFVRKYIELARKSGHKVVVDKWQGHNKHSIQDSARKLSSANFIYCEWMLGNAVWYSENKLNHQKLITRFHRQELETDYPKQVNLNNIDEVHFIAPLVMRDARKLFWDDEAIGVLRENYIDSEALDKPKFTNAKYTLGLVGIVPRMKRIDKALDLLEELRRKDDRYTLRIKGKLPSDFDWMKSRKDEMRYYDKQFQRIEASEYLRGAVFFDGHGNDMDHWFRNIGYLLSFSDFEGCHLSAMEAMGSGAIPLISNWEGAGEIYPRKYIRLNTRDVISFMNSLKIDKKYLQESRRSLKFSKKWSLESYNFKFIKDVLG